MQEKENFNKIFQDDFTQISSLYEPSKQNDKNDEKSKNYKEEKMKVEENFQIKTENPKEITDNIEVIIKKRDNLKEDNNYVSSSETKNANKKTEIYDIKDFLVLKEFPIFEFSIVSNLTAEEKKLIDKIYNRLKVIPDVGEEEDTKKKVNASQFYSPVQNRAGDFYDVKMPEKFYPNSLKNKLINKKKITACP